MPIGPAPRISSFQPTLEPKVLQAEDFGLNLNVQVDQNYPVINAAQDKDKPIFMVFDVALATTTSQTIFCESDIPEWWIITVRPLAAVKVSVFLGPANSGIPIRLSGGGVAKVPGMSNYLTLVNETGGAACQITCAAVRGYPDILIQGGQLA